MKVTKIYSNIVFLLGLILIVAPITSELAIIYKEIIMLFGLNFMILSTLYDKIILSDED